jgi:hypothetical protein
MQPESVYRTQFGLTGRMNFGSAPVLSNGANYLQ